MIIKPGAAQLLVIQVKTQGFDQVKQAAGIGTQADNIAGIGWYFGLVENNIEHLLILSFLFHISDPEKRPGTRY
jgi:hypothetical protein